MKRLTAILFLVVLITALVLAVLSVFDEHSTPLEYSYSGKILLNNTEYDKLKHQLAQPEVRISTLHVFSSEEHLVNFYVIAPVGTQFDYGQVVRTEWKHTVLWDASWFIVILSVVVVLVILVSYTDPTTYE